MSLEMKWGTEELIGADAALFPEVPENDLRMLDGSFVGSRHGRGFEVDGAGILKRVEPAGRVEQRSGPDEVYLGEPAAGWPRRVVRGVRIAVTRRRSLRRHCPWRCLRRSLSREDRICGAVT